MPNIVNQSFFVGDIYISNLSHTADINRITDFINKHEPQCLIKLLGYQLYKLFMTEPSTRMTELQDGAEYTNSLGELRKWQGIKHDKNISLIANYVYFYFQEAQKAQSTGTGTSTSKPEAGLAISPADKMTKAWNFFSDEVKEMSHFLWLKKGLDGTRVYPEFSCHQFLETRRISRKVNSIFQF